jgi:hypothetical protein
MGALLLVLATKPALQLRRGGSVIRDPAEMGRVVRTKTEIQDLTIRLEPPTDRDAIDRLRTLHRQVTGANVTPDDATEITEEIAAWAQNHMEAVQQVHQFVERSFDHVSLATLVDRLCTASEDPSSVEADLFSDPDLQREAQAFRRAWRFVLGEDSKVWTQFIEARRDLRSKAPWEPLMQALERATARPEVPTPEEVIELTRRANEYEPSAEVQEEGPEEPSEDATPSSTWDDFFEEVDFEEDEEIEQRLKAITARLDKEATGRIVVIRKSD